MHKFFNIGFLLRSHLLPVNALCQATKYGKVYIINNDLQYLWNANKKILQSLRIQSELQKPPINTHLLKDEHYDILNKLCYFPDARREIDCEIKIKYQQDSYIIAYPNSNNQMKEISEKIGNMLSSNTKIMSYEVSND